MAAAGESTGVYLIEQSPTTWTIKDVARLALAEPVEANVNRKTVNTSNDWATSG